MAKVCEITGKRPMTGHNVSHSKAHTKRRFMPNLQEKSFASTVLGQNYRLRLTTNAMRTIDKFGGLDEFMKNVKNRNTKAFSPSATRLRKLILKRTTAEAAKETPAAAE
ncbi:MAG: 50S ribosomal protein L28 [Alphaproteobacteria bacterium]|nr:50S ribosomal protein L28 [Alphaproteobacteria bacterium]